MIHILLVQSGINDEILIPLNQQVQYRISVAAGGIFEFADITIAAPALAAPNIAMASAVPLKMLANGLDQQLKKCLIL